MSYIGNTPGVSSQRVVLEEEISGSPKSSFIPIGGYIRGYVDVLVNGSEIDSSDFTANDGVTVTLGTAAAVGDTVKIKTWLPRGLSDGYLKSEADAKFAALINNNMILPANDGGARYIGMAGGSNTSLVIQGGAASGPGANLELTNDFFAYLDANTSRMRSVDGSTVFVEISSTGLNVVTGTLKQTGYQVVHAGNYTTFAAKPDGTNATGTWPISISGTAAVADLSVTAAKLAAGAAAANLGFTPYTQAQVDAALAGKQASLGFTPANAASFAVSISSSGYQKLPGGLIIQWGWRPNGGVGFFWQTFPMAFPNACFGLTTNVVRSSAMGDYRGWYGANTSGAYIATDQGDAFYIAVGY